ncbi:unnamed protein product, partial [Ectocarpus fasciculatus]
HYSLTPYTPAAAGRSFFTCGDVRWMHTHTLRLCNLSSAEIFGFLFADLFRDLFGQFDAGSHLPSQESSVGRYVATKHELLSNSTAFSGGWVGGVGWLGDRWRWESHRGEW